MASVSRDQARRYLVGQMGLRGVGGRRGRRGVREVLAERRHIQLDPLDPMGQNADLVAMARVDGLARGDVYRHVLPGHAFEHFAKERCLLPTTAFPYYRDQAAETPWWRQTERMRRITPDVLRWVLSDVEANGPVTAAELADHGTVDPIDWSGWKSTAKASSMALEILWTRCQVVVTGRRSNGAKLYDVPSRALPEVHDAEAGDFARWALLERVEAAGLLARAGGPHWSILGDTRKSSLPDDLIAEGRLEQVTVEGSSRPYLAPAGFLSRSFGGDDGRMRILGPLDALLWDRKLVSQVFGFDYVWEVYKPAKDRKWGWYVCPLLHRGRLVGRLEGRVRDDALVIERLYRERDARLDESALDACLERHAVACGCDYFEVPKPVHT